MNLMGKGPMGQKDAPDFDFPEYLDAVRELPCCICEAFGETQTSRTTAHHPICGRHSTKKRPDRTAIPLCDGHHQGTFDTSKIAIHRDRDKWVSRYGKDTEWISATQDKLSHILDESFKSVVDRYLDYDPNTGLLFWKRRPTNRVKVGDVAGSPHGNGYISTKLFGKSVFAHRVAFLLMEGEWPDQVDHINGSRDDNRWENLRNVSHKENHRNQKMRKNNKSGCLGVSWSKRDKRWVARITVSGRQLHVGQFSSKDDAVRARKIAETKHDFHPNHGMVK